MKKTALFLLLLLSFQTVQAEVLPPVWEEFCPTQYCAAQAGPEVEYNRGKYLAATFIPFVGLVALPLSYKASAKASESQRRNYWAARRQQFENEVATCQQTESDKAMCYLQIRQMEAQKNAARQASVDMQQLRETVRRHD